MSGAWLTTPPIVGSETRQQIEHARYGQPSRDVGHSWPSGATILPIASRAKRRSAREARGGARYSGDSQSSF